MRASSVHTREQHDIRFTRFFGRWRYNATQGHCTATNCFVSFLFVVSFQPRITDEGSTSGLIEMRDHAVMRLAMRVAVVAVACCGVSNLSYCKHHHSVGRCVVLIIVNAFPPPYLSSLKLSLSWSRMVSNSFPNYYPDDWRSRSRRLSHRRLPQSYHCSFAIHKALASTSLSAMCLSKYSYRTRAMRGTEDS